MKKTLFFEGAGWSEAKIGNTDIPNCRIRTAFTNNKGKKIYLEIIGNIVYKERSKALGIKTGDAVGWVDCVHEITDDPNIDDCNERKLKLRGEHFLYNYETLKAYVNNTFDCSFDEIKVLNELTGYRVFNDDDGGTKYGTFAYYNYGDEFDYNEEKTERRLAKAAEFDKYFETFSKYSNASYWVAANGNLIVRINADDATFKKMGYEERQFEVAI